MSSIRRGVGIAVLSLGSTWLAATSAWSQGASSHASSQTKDRARIVLSQILPKLDSGHLKAFLLEVRYGPGEASPPHSHSCAVIGYVVEGALRTQVQGEPERVYTTGESFYEAPNGVHLVSANASATEPAKFVAYLICDRDGPLSVDVPELHPEGASK